MEDLDIYGEKGGGGHTPTESKDTLKSKQTMRLLFALSEGEIDSVTDILVNSASISNYAADVVTWQTRTGTVDQELIKGFSEVEAPIAGSGTFPLELKYNVEKIYTLLGQYDAGRITLSIDRLVKVTDEGDRVGYEVSLDIYKRRKLANGTTENWQLASAITKKGKCTNVYAWDVRVDKPAGTLFADSWEIKVVRTSLDDAKDKLMSKTFLANIITIAEKTLTYPKTALVGVTIFDAKNFGTSIPELKFKVKGMKFLLPSNYTVSGRNYNESTPWNGSFKSYTEYTDNLAWVTYWVLRNTEWGLGVSAADIDLGSFYTYAKHCDELVPAGNTTEPRYTAHLQCIERENVPTFLMKLLTLGNANFSSNAFGQIKIVWDGAGQAITKVVSNATVIDGMFDYTSNDLEGRTNLVNVTYAREDFFGDSDTVTHYEDSLITRYGLQTSDVILLGCKSEYQALRKARWTLYNNCYSGDMVTFKQLFQGAHYQIGELVSLMDSDNVSSNAKHGIIKSSSVAGGQVTIVLDRTITLANASYSVEFIGTDGTTFSSKTINQSNGSFSTITFVGTDSPYTGSTILFKTAALTPRVVKILKIEKDDSHVYNITGLTHDEDKYNYIDSTGTIVNPSTSGSYVNFDNFNIPAVTNLVIDQVHVVNRGVEFSKLEISWDWSSGSTVNDFKAIFEVSYRRDAQDFIQLKDLSTTNFDIEYPLPGVYEVYVWAVNPFSGIKSIVTTTINPYNYRVAAAVSSLVPPITVVVPNTTGVAFTQPDLHLSWVYNTVNDTKEDALKDYVVQVLDTTTRTVKGTYTVIPNKDKGGEFVFTFYENFTIFGTPQRNFIVKVYSRDIIGDLSNYIEVNPTNVVPVVQSFDIISGVSSVFVRITTTPEADIAGYQVFRSLTANFTKNSSTLIYDGPDTYITLNVPSSSTYYYAVAAYDSFSKTGLSISGEQNSTPLSADATTWTKTGLQFTVDSGVANKLNWTAGTIIRNGSNTYTITAGTVTWTAGFVYVYFNPAVSLTALQVTTTLLTAVSVGSYPIATYTGGSASNIKGGDGNAFISGSQIIAGTVGASEIKAGSIVASLIDTTNAVITGTAQITDGIITNAKIGNSIMSLDYNPTTFKGWKIDKAGNIDTYGSLGIYDSSGNVVFAGGNFNWNNAKGTGLPQVGATRNVFLGNWTSGANYVVGDIVMDALGYGWSCVTVHTSSGSASTPVYPTTSNSYWALYTIKGGTGPAGLTTATVYIYQRSATAPALPTATTTYTFSSAVLTGLNNGWVTSIPTGTADLYVSAATASAGTATDTIASTEWASAVILAKNGIDGNPGGAGANGINTATIYLYQTTATATPPSLPNANVTYTFATGVTTGVTNNWVRSLPTTGAYRWVTTGTALSTETTDIITSAEWATVSLLSQDGINGIRTAIMDMYQWSATAPTLFPAGTSTYTWATGQFTAPGTLNSWSLTPSTPVKGQTLYVTRTIYADSSNTATTSITWNATTATPRSIAGSDGSNGTRTAFMEMYLWSANTPSSYPTGNSTYTWATGAFTAPSTPNSWSLLPGAAVKGQTLYAIGQNYSDTGTSASTAIAWASSTPYAVGSAGSDGTPGVCTFTAEVYYNGITTTPPTGGSYNFSSNVLTAPSGWAKTPYASTSTGTSISTCVFTTTTPNTTVSATGWSTPALYQKNGSDGKAAIVAQLSSDSLVISCNNDGSAVTGAFATATVTMTVMNGTTDDSANWTYTVSLSNCTSSTLSTSRSQTLNGITTGVSTAYIDFTASRTGYSSLTKRCVISKSYMGGTGIAGAGTNYTGASDPTTSTPAAAINGDSYFQTTSQLMWVKVAGVWKKVIPQITSGNATTFIASAAVGQVQAGSAALGTLQIDGEAITVDYFSKYNTAATIFRTTSPTAWSTMYTYSVPSNSVGYPVAIELYYNTLAGVGTVGTYVSVTTNIIATDNAGTVLAIDSFSKWGSTSLAVYKLKVPVAPSGNIIIKAQYLVGANKTGGVIANDVSLNNAYVSIRTVKR